MRSNLLTADGITVGMRFFFSKILSKTFGAASLNCGPILVLFP